MLLARLMSRTREAAGTLGASRSNLAVLSAGYAVFAVSLLAQSARWAATPAYENLLRIMPQAAWGGIFAGVSALMAAAVAWPQRRAVAVTAITAAVMITTGWAASFIVRWLTSPATTPETWVSWIVFDYLLIRSALLLDFREVLIPARRPPAPPAPPADDDGEAAPPAQGGQ